MDIICRDGKFSGEQLEFYKLHNISVPKEDSLYSIRSINKLSNGKTGILLNEIINPPCPIKHRILGIVYREVDWNINRFRKLNGDIISKEEIKELIKEKI